MQPDTDSITIIINNNEIGKGSVQEELVKIAATKADNTGFKYSIDEQRKIGLSIQTAGNETYFLANVGGKFPANMEKRINEQTFGINQLSLSVIDELKAREGEKINKV